MWRYVHYSITCLVPIINALLSSWVLHTLTSERWIFSKKIEEFCKFFLVVLKVKALTVNIIKNGTIHSDSICCFQLFGSKFFPPKHVWGVKSVKIFWFDPPRPALMPPKIFKKIFCQKYAYEVFRVAGRKFFFKIWTWRS